MTKQTELLPLNPDELLSTTRAVRKRLDFDKPVSLDLVKEIIEVAVQAPTGSNSQGWHWIILTDPKVKEKVAALYKKSFDYYRTKTAVSADKPAKYHETQKKVSSSADYLSENFAKAPVLIIAAITAETELPAGNQAGLWGSLLPAAWSFALAARARGLGTAWTTLHLAYEKEIAELLNIPANVHQGVLFPLAYTKGTDFKSGPRLELEPIIHVNTW